MDLVLENKVFLKVKYFPFLNQIRLEEYVMVYTGTHSLRSINLFYGVLENQERSQISQVADLTMHFYKSGQNF